MYVTPHDKTSSILQVHIVISKTQALSCLDLAPSAKLQERTTWLKRSSLISCPLTLKAKGDLANKHLTSKNFAYAGFKRFHRKDKVSLKLDNYIFVGNNKLKATFSLLRYLNKIGG
jgi:hypothetical protein